ncbi:TPA: trigger factor [Candidatus Gastranaerophilales bacterium HUM_3]|jgi:trigger factor|nr:trigger factor [Acinetobacter sp.]OLA73180.1 MAG: trigger factor [Acinetobacter sp. CAG:196_36_41]CCZ50100.1 trigger factor [Acinetobacter sp. CAG:196]DAA82328.1 MAG TPA: trigger factor [Candidatus Gastranaerophilales bacterium HUM_3]DAA99588.1 MAG TPA: trigger factor [Candidatus Gastranaerophilales bacterium HUM_11]DAB04856.1 MAG TPA: trigger factor [Candidatus Gastranaerophilales bacterium HUM_13]DAB10898.1 MAG TPA: trigger factor [Candidatus Gastranaerophilales bacterium HUM_15]DAB1232
MKTTIEKQPENIVKVDIEVPAKDAVNYYNNAAKRLAQYVNIPGFRKGKAPRNIVEQNIGEERIKHEALEGALPKIFSEVIKENDFDVVAQPYVESYDYKIGEDLRIVAKLELRPEVTLGEYKGLTIEVEEYKTPEDALQKSIDSLLEQHATTVVVTDRKTLNTDTIVFDFEGFSNGEKIEHGDAKNYTLDLAHSSFIPGFAEQLADRTLGEEFEINVTFPEEYHEKKLAGQPAVFKCKVNEIRAKVLPELTDEFAQKVGPFKTVDDLKADIQKYLDTQKADIDRTNSEKAIFEKVTGDAKVEIQQSMIDREADQLAEEYKQKLSMQGFSWDQAVEAQGYDNIMNSLKEDAAMRVKNSLVIDKIAKEENLVVSQAEFGAKLSEIGRMYQMDTPTMIKQLSQTPGVFNAISQQALNEKVTQFLAENNTVKFK